MGEEILEGIVTGALWVVIAFVGYFILRLMFGSSEKSDADRKQELYDKMNQVEGIIRDKDGNIGLSASSYLNDRSSYSDDIELDNESLTIEEVMRAHEDLRQLDEFTRQSTEDMNRHMNDHHNF